YLKAKLDYEFFKNFESEHTRRNYYLDIRQFFQFIAQSFTEINNPQKIERVHIVAYRNFLSDKQLAPKSINRKLSSLSSYMDFLVEKGLMNFNPTDSIRRPRQEVIRPTEDLSDDQVVNLFAAIEENKVSGPLHKAIIYLLFSTGIRKSELINLKMKSFKTLDGHRIIEFRAKGGKFLTKVLHPNCVLVLEDYLRWMEKQGRRLDKEDYFFRPTRNPKDPAQLDNRLAPTSVDYIIHIYCQRAGIEGRITPHSARATYIGSALENGVDLLRVSQDVGHASVKTTQEYNKRRQKLTDSPVYKIGFLKKAS
ncbi:MAG: tyrosine-type recombinase/integrase, partial [Pseudomonadota bacterium]